ncbi:MAG: hypothetical protein KF757_13520 [Phycisphaeraceae bacterium]|nr:hypothetical protein [Phycisphaeraceae bacterium]MCW5763981.1 hypothetical protein [Phycisphaeraceae bacterium]
MSDRHIAMWSGPRNISTALMRSFESRPDTFVSDEPLYAHYLKSTNLDHPARDQIIREHESDWQIVTRALVGPIPRNKTIWYQKHMAHHLTPEVGRKWIHSLHNVFLIRQPEDMITSFIKVIPDPRPTDLGLPQQLELFASLYRRTGKMPIVIDSRDILLDPHSMLSRLCHALDIPFTNAMLSWQPGPRDTDGVWGPHWYDSVYASTSFAPYLPKNERVPSHLAAVLDDCLALYHQLAQHKLTLPTEHPDAPDLQ